MTVSNISSVANSYSTPMQNGLSQRFQDFRSLAQALHSGDLNKAQSAFAAFQKDLQGSSTATQASELFGQNSQANSDFQSLQNALQKGDLSAAKTAFANLKQDLQGAGRAHHYGHHHRVDRENDGDSDDGTAASTAISTGGVLDTQA